MTPDAPRYLFIETTTQCNLMCRQCHMWMSSEPDDALSTAEKLGLVRQLNDWSKEPTVVLTGGETMAKLDQFFAITEACRELGFSSAANTNGTHISNGVVSRLLETGPTYLVVSLDSHDEEIHDWLRRRKGTFKSVVSALRALVREREAMLSQTDVKLFVNAILFDRNIHEVVDLVSFVTSLGVDGIMFQVLSRTFLNQGNGDTFFDGHFPGDVGLFDDTIDQLVALKSDGAPILTDDRDLQWMKLYVRNPDFISDTVCGSAERNMMVDQRGDAQLCFGMRELTGGLALGNVRQTTLRDLWASDVAENARRTMASCRRNCGMLNCHRREQ